MGILYKYKSKYKNDNVSDKKSMEREIIKSAFLLSLGIRSTKPKSKSIPTPIANFSFELKKEKRQQPQVITQSIKLSGLLSKIFIIEITLD